MFTFRMIYVTSAFYYLNCMKKLDFHLKTIFWELFFNDEIVTYTIGKLNDCAFRSVWTQLCALTGQRGKLLFVTSV